MAKSVANGKQVVVADMGSPNSEAQWKYFLSTTFYTCYGGARGGGKTWCTDRKAPMLAYEYPGIRILIVRREFADMEDTIINPIQALLAPGTFTYNKSEHKITFTNGSYIRFGNMPDYNATIGGKYQGQEFDVVFLEEGTQFLETEFRGIAATIRGTNGFPKRLYMTCNPGGVGHNWVKRLFIDRKFKEDEDPDDYLFIPATVKDNVDLQRANPEYIKQLNALPPDIRKAHRDGDWNALSGAFFSDFTEGVNTCKPFPIPPHWKHYRAMDYGLDCHFCIWVAVDEHGKAYVYREFSESDQTVSQAAETQLKLTRPDEQISYTIAPPDMWFRNRVSGKSQADYFSKYGVPLVRCSNDRINGWAATADMLQIRGTGENKTANLVIFDTCPILIDCIKCVQHDTKNPNDVSQQPHGITHGPDALRHFCISYVLPAEIPEDEEDWDDDETGGPIDYVTEVCGTGVSDSYIL